MQKAKKSLGRKWKDTDEVVDNLVRAFEDGANISEACRIAKIDRQTYYNWLEDSEEFSTLMTDSQNYPDVVAKMVLVRAIKKSDIDVSKWWAERRMKNEFSTRNEMTGKDGEHLIPRFTVQTKEAKQNLEQLYEGPNSSDNKRIS